MRHHEGIAIVGIGAILPDAHDYESLWQNLLARRCAIRPVPAEIWESQVFYDPQRRQNDKSNSCLGAVVGGFEFDPRRFNMPPAAANDLDITQKAALVASQAALAEIGIHGPAEGINAAVIVGNVMGGTQGRSERILSTSHSALEATIQGLPSFQELHPARRAGILAELRQGWYDQFTPLSSYSLPGVLGNVIAARVARWFNFHGPTFAVDAACASSLAALDIARQGLSSHRYDLALVGGIDFFMDAAAYAGFSAMNALSDDGSYPFDARASGFVMGEGAVMFVLKRLKDAQDAGDHIHAIVEGVGSSSDGHSGSLVAPNFKGQTRALKRAYQDAGVSPLSLGYVEAHGTATPVGDPVEVLAMSRAFADCPQGSIAIGSIKANLGHLKAAAGAAGLLRAVLALETRTIPPQANFEQANPRCRFESAPVRVPIEAQDWPKDKTHAAVSAFGFGGINYHAVLRRSEGTAARPRGAVRGACTTGKLTPAEYGVIAFGAATREELLQTAAAERERIDAGVASSGRLTGAVNLQSAAFRAAFYASNTSDAREMLEALIAGVGRAVSPARLRNLGIFHREESAAPPEGLAFMFTGQGSQYLGMLDQLRARFPVIESTLREADEILCSHFPQPLSSYFSTGGTTAGEAERTAMFARLSQTDVLQPALIACNEALRRALSQFVRPSLVLGHSLGECSAAIAAGVMSFEAGLKFAAERGRLLSEVAPDNPGLLLQVAASEQQIAAVLAQVTGYVTVANRNCDRQTVIGGAATAVHDAERLLRARGIDCSPLPVSHAFHTKLMAPAVEPLRRFLDEMNFNAPAATMVSSLTGELVPAKAEAAYFRDVLSRQIAEPVEYIKAVRTAIAAGARIFVEVGPKHAQCGFVRDIVGEASAEVIATCHPKVGEVASFGRALAALVADGLISYHAESDPGSSARIARRAPYVGRVTRRESTDRSAPEGEGLGHNVPAYVAPITTALHAAVGEDQRFWQFFARQADALAAYLVASYRALDGSATSLLQESPLESGVTALPGSPSRKPPVELGEASLQDRVLSLLAKKTGYSLEELKLDAHLENELGIDSITQLEIVAELKSLLNLPADDSFRISEHPTLRQLIAYVESRRGPEAPQTNGDIEPEMVSGADDLLAAPFYAGRLVYETCSAKGADAALGSVLALHKGTLAELVERLNWRSVHAPDDEGAAKALESADQGFDTLVLLEEATGATGITPLMAAQAAVRRASRLGASLLGTRASYARLMLIVAGAADGQLDDSTQAWAGATVAAWKSIHRELSEMVGRGAPVEFRVIELESSFHALEEPLLSLLREEGPAEIRLTKSKQRTVPVIRPCALSSGNGSKAAPVVIVTGGARGIMARISRELFETSGCKLVLAGRTPAAADVVEFEATSARAAAQLSLGKSAPIGAINARVEEQRRRAEVAQTLRELANRGAQVLYIQADIGQPGEISRVLREARARFGSVEWLVHGAGIDNSKGLTAKTDADLEGVLRPKLTFLEEWAHDPDAPTLVAISSIAARFGNSGQFEYAAANAALARVALAHGGLAIDFGPWRETGMAAGIASALKARGIDALDCKLAAGVATQIMTRCASAEYVVAGRLGRNALVWLGRDVRIDLDIPGTLIAVSADIHFAQSAWLRDHCWQGVGLTPGVASLTAFVELALVIEPGLPICAIESLELRKPIVVKPDRPTSIQVRADRVASAGSVVRIDAEIRAGRVCLQRATLLLGAPIVPAPVTVDFNSSGARQVHRDDIYAQLFHGESMRVLDRVEIRGTRSRGVSRPLTLPLGEDLPELHRATALARELALQTAGVYSLFERRTASLPERIDRLTIFDAPRRGEIVSASVECLEIDEDAVFDIVLSGEDGRLLERIEKLHLRRVTAPVRAEVGVSAASFAAHATENDEVAGAMARNATMS